MQPLRVEAPATKNSYESTVQELARQTSPEDTRILLVALNSLGAPIPERIPEPWRGVFQLIHGTPVELQDKKNQLISIARQALVHGLEAPQQATSLEAPQQTPSEEPANKAPRLGTQSGIPGGMFDMMPSPLLSDFIFGYLPPRSRALLAQTGRMMRDAVRAHAAHQVAGFNNDPDLKDMLERLNEGPMNAENFDAKMNRLITSVVPMAFQYIEDSTVMSDEEKKAFLQISPKVIVNDRFLLRQMFQAFYDSIFVEFIVLRNREGLSAETLSAIRAAPKLEDKAAIADAALRVARFNRWSGDLSGCLDSGSIDAENFDVKMNGLFINVLSSIIQDIKKQSTCMSDDEKEALPKTFVSDPRLLHQVLQILRDVMLADSFCTGTNEGNLTAVEKKVPAEILSAIRSTPKLENKVKIIRERLPDITAEIESIFIKPYTDDIFDFLSAVMQRMRSFPVLQSRRSQVDAFLRDPPATPCRVM